MHDGTTPTLETIYLTEVDYEDPDFPAVWASSSADSGGTPYVPRACIEAMQAEVDRFSQALIDHNDLLRSAFEISKREGVGGLVASTNWDAFYNRVVVVLKRHHETTNAARAARAACKPDAP